MRPYILAEANYKDIKAATIDLAVLPWGATEAHNYHLPYGTDVYESEYLSAECARQCHEAGGRVMVLPSIPFGVNTGQADVPFNINMNPTTQLAILDDVAATLVRHGVPKLMIFNSHGGNNFKPLVRELGLRYPSLFVCFVNWFQSFDKTKFFEHQGDHADEMETSVMLYLRPELIVVPREEWGSGATKSWKVKGFQEPWAWAERQWMKVTEDTGIGDPRAATAEKGEAYFKAVTTKIGSFMLEVCEMDKDSLYE